MNNELNKTSVKIAFAITVGALISPAAQASSIIGGSTLLDAASLTQLEGYLGEGQLDITNIFTKQAGSTSVDFHAAADGQGRTFSVLRATGTEQAPDGSTTRFSEVIGGYNPQSWNSSTAYNNVFDTTQRSAFLFNLTNNTLFRENTALDPNYGDTGSIQTYNYSGLGPTFGYGDLITDSTLINGGTNTFSYSNNLPFTGDTSLLLGLAGISVTTDGFGSGPFLIGDLEVFTIADSPVSSVPLPAALPLMSSAIGLFGIGAARRRNKLLA